MTTGTVTTGTKTERRLDDKRWLMSVRSDLDTDAGEWSRKPDGSGSGQSKGQAIASYLDVILTELGYPVSPHECPRCGLAHRASR